MVTENDQCIVNETTIVPQNRNIRDQHNGTGGGMYPNIRKKNNEPI